MELFAVGELDSGRAGEEQGLGGTDERDDREKEEVWSGDFFDGIVSFTAGDRCERDGGGTRRYRTRLGDGCGHGSGGGGGKRDPDGC